MKGPKPPALLMGQWPAGFGGRLVVGWSAQAGPHNSPEPYCRGAMSNTGFWTPKAVMKILTTTMMKTRPVARLLRKSSLACLAGLLRSYLTVGEKVWTLPRLPALGLALGPRMLQGPPCPSERHACSNALLTVGMACDVGWMGAQRGLAPVDTEWEAPTQGPGLDFKAQCTEHTQASTFNVLCVVI